MIELIVLIFLCRKTTQNAGLRGQSKAGAVAYTIGLWAGMEIIGISCLAYFKNPAGNKLLCPRRNKQTATAQSGKFAF